MLENTPFWTKGPMNLWVDNKPAHVYVPEDNVKEAYQLLESRLSKDGSIPIGIDHLPDNIIEANPILAKLDLLNVGEITEIEYADDTISIVEAEFTNPQIQALYDAGELDMVSIVAISTTSECPKNDYDYVLKTTDITRVDIVEKGACPICNIPKPTESSDTVVYARYSIKTMEENTMAEEVLTAEAIQEIIDTALNPIKETLDKQDKRIAEIEKELKPDEGTENKPAEESEEVKAMKAQIADLKKETATAKVDSLIAAGKVLPSQKEAMIDICASNSESFEKMMEDAPVIVDFDKHGVKAGDSGNDNDPEPTDDEKLIAEVQAAFNKGE